MEEKEKVEIEKTKIRLMESKNRLQELELDVPYLRRYDT